MAVDMDIQGIVLFFVFIIPGFVFTRTYLAYKPRYYKQPNALEQTALSLIGSAFIHGSLLGAATIGVLLVWLFTGVSIGTGLLFGATIPMMQYPLHILALFINLLIGYLVLSLVLARRTAIFLGKRPSSRSAKEWWHRIIGEDPPESSLLWHTVLQDVPLKKGIMNPKVSIRLRNGDHFKGNLNRLKLVGDEENTIELAITDVDYHSEKETSGKSTMLHGQTVLLNSKDILWLSRADT